MGLPGPARTHEQHILPFSEVVAAGEVEEQGFVDTRPGGEVELVEGLGGGEPGGLEPTVGRLPFPFDEFEFHHLQQEPEVVDVVGRGPSRHLLALGQDGRKLQGFQVVLQEDGTLRVGLHVTTPTSIGLAVAVSYSPYAAMSVDSTRTPTKWGRPSSRNSSVG